MTRCYDDAPELSIRIGRTTAETLLDAALYRVGELLIAAQMRMATDDERASRNREAQQIVGEIAAVRALLQDALADAADRDAPELDLYAAKQGYESIPDPRPEPTRATAHTFAVVDDHGSIVQVFASSEAAEQMAREWDAARVEQGGDPIYAVRRLGGSHR